MSTERAVDVAERFADGQWHRMHPVTPLLRGGFVVIVILGFVVANLRQRIIDLLIGTPGDFDGDPIDAIVSHGLVGWALLVIAGVLALLIAIFYVMWRAHLFRIGDETVEMRRGVISRSYRKARLDRIQGINIARPLTARIFGVARLEIVVAGQDANLDLAYLRSGTASGLREDILARASGARRAEAESAWAAPAGQPLQGPASPTAPASPSYFAQRAGEFRQDYDLDVAPESLVRLHPGRLVGSLALSGSSVVVLVLVGVVIAFAVNSNIIVLVSLIPGLLAVASVYSRRFTKSVRYSIAGTRDGVRVGFGLLSTTTEIIPPGRVHGVEVVQPVLWRPVGWWEVRISTAGQSRQKGAAGQPSTTVLPVGDAGDVARVVGLLLPPSSEGWSDRLREGMVGSGRRRARARVPEEARFGTAPRRAAWLHPFSWRRIGYLSAGPLVAFRAGLLRRRLTIVPYARLQSVEVAQGPVERLLGLASARLHLVAGPVNSTLPVLAAADAESLFETVAAAAVHWGGRETSQRWGLEAPDDGGRP